MIPQAPKNQTLARVIFISFISVCLLAGWHTHVLYVYAQHIYDEAMTCEHTDCVAAAHMADKYPLPDMNPKVKSAKK